MKTKDGRDLPIAEITAENYIVPKGEENLYHVKQKIAQHDTRTGKDLLKPCIQKYGKRMFETIVYDNLLRLGYTVEVLHKPGAIAKDEPETVPAKEEQDAATANEEQDDDAQQNVAGDDEPEATPAEGKKTRGRNA